MAEEKILDRVRNLLNKANQTEFPEERDALIEKADELMVKYAIDAAMLDAKMTKDERRKPVKDVFKAADPNAPHWEKFRTVLRYIAELHHCRIAFHYAGNVTLFGFHEDVEYVKMKWLNVYLHFSKTINPSWDNSLSVGQNAYNFHQSGTAWTDVEGIAINAGQKFNIKQLRSAYRAHCAAIGEEPKRMTQNNWAYKEAFAEAFRTRIVSRIVDMIEKRNSMESEAGALVAVKDLGIEIDELFYESYPNRRPLSPEQLAELERLEAERKAEEQRRLEAMSPAERREYDRQQEAQLRQQARDNAQFWRAQEKREGMLHRSGGIGAGRRSADQVDLSRNEGVANSGRREL